MRRLLVVAGLLLGLTFAASSAAAPTATWLTTRSNAQLQLRDRFANVATVSCAPDRTSATQLFGTNRYWQRFWCTGRTYDRLSFRLRFRTTGQCGDCWTITNLTGIGVERLRTKAVAPAPQTASPTTSSGSCPSSYYRNSSGHCVPRPSTDPTLEPGGPTAICNDGTYSYSENASGTCSHHGGVAQWLHHP